MSSAEGGLSRRDFIKRGLAAAAAVALQSVPRTEALAEAADGFISFYKDGKLDDRVVGVLERRGFGIEEFPELKGTVLVITIPGRTSWIDGTKVRSPRDELAFYMHPGSTLMLRISETETILRRQFLGKISTFVFPGAPALSE